MPPQTPPPTSTSRRSSTRLRATADRRRPATRAHQRERTSGSRIISARTAIVTAPLSPPRGHDDQPIVDTPRGNSRSTGSATSKKLSISASSIGSTRMTCGPGCSPAIENCPSRVEREVRRPSRRVAGSNATTCAPKTPRPFFVTRPETLPVVAVEAAVGIEVRDAGDVVRLRACGRRCRRRRAQSET